MTLTPDTEIDKGILEGVGPTTIKKLKDVGLVTLQQIAVLHPMEIVARTGMGIDTAVKVSSLAQKAISVYKTADELYQERKKSIRRLKTGVPEFDELLGGGFESGVVTELSGEFACHSTDTFVVTPSGIKTKDEIKIDDVVLGMTEDRRITETTVKNIFNYSYDGFLYEFKNTRFNLLVTPNHEIYFKDHRANEFIKIKAEEVAKRRTGKILCSFDWQGKEQSIFDIYAFIEPVEHDLKHPLKSHPKAPLLPLNTEDFMELVGWYISEGSLFICERGTYFQIRNSTYVNEITELLNRLNLDYGLYENSKFIIFHRDLAKYMMRCGTSSSTKKIPRELMSFDKKYLLKLFNALMMGDGHKNRHTYYSISIQLLHDFMILAMKLGFNTTMKLKDKAGRKSIIRDRTIKSKHDYYYINIAYEPSGYFDKRQNCINKIPYQGIVWCLETDTGNFFTIRDGQPTLSGNSGKTQVCFNQTVMVQLPPPEGFGEKAIVIDTEKTFAALRVAEIAESRGLDLMETLQNIHIIEAYNSQHLEILVRGLPEKLQEGGFGLVVVDSLIGHFRSEYIGRENLAPRQQKLGAVLSNLLRVAESFNLVVLVTNQAQANPTQWGNPNRPAGGHIMGHGPAHRLWLRKGRVNLRIAKMIDSSYLPEGEAPFYITAGGISGPEE